MRGFGSGDLALLRLAELAGLREPCPHRFRRHGFPEKISLPDLASERCHAGAKVGVFDTFGGCRQVQALRHAEDAVYDFSALGIFPDRLDEAAVDLDLV